MLAFSLLLKKSGARAREILFIFLHFIHVDFQQDRAERSDLGGCHQQHRTRGSENVGVQFAPGVAWTVGTPTNASPFIQVRLPKGFQCEGRSSRAVSFMPSEGRMERGTTRTRKAAEEMAAAWSWRWFSSLSASVQKCVSDASAEGEPASKKRKIE